MFDFSSYYDVAEYLVKIDEEGNVRSGISRYYYSGFGFARYYLINVMHEYEFVSRHEIHQRVCERLMQSGDNTEASIGEKLEELRAIRNQADYDWKLGMEHFAERLPCIQKDSMEIIEQLNALKNTPPLKL